MNYRDPLATLCSSVWLIRKEGRELAELDGYISQSFYLPFSAKGKDANISQRDGKRLGTMMKQNEIAAVTNEEITEKKQE